MKNSKYLFWLSGVAMPLVFVRWPGFPVGVFEGIAILAVIVYLLEGNKIYWPKNPVIKMGIALLAIGFLIGAIKSPDVTHAAAALILWFVLPVVWALCLSSFKEGQKYLGWGSFCGLLIALLWVAVQLFGFKEALFWQGDIGQYVNNNRMTGPFNSPNALAIYALPAGLMASYLIEDKTRKYWPLIIALIIIIATLSKGAILAFILGGLAAIVLAKAQSNRFLHFGRNDYLKWFGFTVIIITLITSWIFARYGSLRPEIWSAAWSLFKDNWLLGIGLDNFGPVFKEKFVSLVNFVYIAPFAIHPHNLFLALSLYLGIFGFIGFVIIWLKGFFGAVTLKNILLIWLFLAIIIHGMADTTFFGAVPATLFFTGLFLSIKGTDE